MTYDLTDELVEQIKAAGIVLPEPVGQIWERLVFNAQAVREHFDGQLREDEQKLLDEASDEKIGALIGDADGIYEAWTNICDDVVLALYQEAHA